MKMYWQQGRRFDPERITAISRGLSAATPLVRPSHSVLHPERMQADSTSRGHSHLLASLRDVTPCGSSPTGGVAALNPRLISAIPSGSSRMTPFIALLIGAIVFVWSAVSRADDAAKSDDVKQNAAKQKADPPKEPSLLDNLSKELLKEIDDDLDKPKPEKQEDKFDRVAKGMRSASEKLDGKVIGDETTKIQEQVIRDLDELIKQLQNPPPNGGGGGGGVGSSGGGSSKSAGGGGGSRQQRAGGRGGKGQPQGGTPKQQAQGNGGEQGSKDRKDAEGSEERTDSERKAAAEAARKKKLEIDVWGHLPPHLRDQLLNTYGERMLPKYEQLVKQFYEALSEQNEAKPRR